MIPMVRKLYHGSCSIIEKPVFGQGKWYNDYGIGFYCTDSLEMAKEWGVSHDKDGYANCYELDCDSLRILDLNDPQYCILHWLAVLLENREFDVTSALALEAKEICCGILSILERQTVIIGYKFVLKILVDGCYLNSLNFYALEQDTCSIR
ncbi:MAG: DUF3990 domain-containing protein [Ruminococcaceae bacterium]|nr:DUF3990 domain-containing protein [Oscillospiraceae bacterium]